MRSGITVVGVDPRFVAGVVEVEGLTSGPAPPELDAAIELLLGLRRSQSFPPTEQRDGIRRLLRSGGYKPSGRGKPASEYLAAAARRDTFPRISNLVDVANHYSLLTGLPISLVDLDAALQGASSLELRLGQPGERYVFNPGGQDIDLAGLICVARTGGGAVGNPVKDSLATRTGPETRAALAVIYASTDVVPADVVERMAAQLGEQLRKHCGAKRVSSAVARSASAAT